VTDFVRGVQFRGQEVGESVQEKGKPLLVAAEPHASGGIDALSACLPASPVRESHVAQEAPQLQVSCAWCGILITPGVMPVSHGCCKPCADRMTEQIRAHRAAKEAAK